MVKFYSKKKKKEQMHDAPSLFLSRSEKDKNQTSFSTSNELNSPQNNWDFGYNHKGENNKAGLSWEEEDEHIHFFSSSVSPSFLKVDYNNTVLSDAERNRDSMSPNLEIGPTPDKSKSEKDFCGFSVSEKSRRVSLQEESNSSNSSPMLAMRSFISASVGDLKETQSEVIQPSPFLIEYLVSKSKFLSTPQNSIFMDEPKSISSAFVIEEIETLWQHEAFLAPPPAPPCGSWDKTTPGHREAKKDVSLQQKNNQVCKPKRSHFRSHSDGLKGITADPPKMRRTSMSLTEKQPPVSTGGGLGGSRNSVRKTFMEDGGQSITPVADGFFPKPQPGQTLMDFLTSDQFTKASAQLDRENAHFSVAEAVLAAIEQVIKWIMYKRIIFPPIPV